MKHMSYMSYKIIVKVPHVIVDDSMAHFAKTCHSPKFEIESICALSPVHLYHHRLLACVKGLSSTNTANRQLKARMHHEVLTYRSYNQEYLSRPFLGWHTVYFSAGLMSTQLVQVTIIGMDSPIMHRPKQLSLSLAQSQARKNLCFESCRQHSCRDQQEIPSRA